MDATTGTYKSVVLGCLVALALSGLVACGGDDDGGKKDITPTPGAPTPTPTIPPEPCDLPEPFCGTSFPMNTQWTTQYGVSWADIVTEKSDWIPCKGPYALCYYANCTLEEDGSVGDCPCFAAYGTSYVDMNAILNLDLYNETVSFCSQEGDPCSTPNAAPVCAAINSGSFLEGAARISTFSLYRATTQPIGNKDCTDEPMPYAGCMTGPCFGDPQPGPTPGTFTIDCDCPVWDGPFQVGTSDVPCEDEAGMAYSAAWSVASVPADPCEIIGECIPDAPAGDCGCPLYVPGETLPPDSGVDCDEVCDEYATCTNDDGIELGYTCDATLCTTENQDLVLDACLGLENCDLSAIFAAEKAVGCSCCASQLCDCEANADTNEKVFLLDEAQLANGDTPQCEINDTLCGTPP